MGEVNAPGATLNKYDDSNIKARPPAKYSGLSSASDAFSKVAASGPWAHTRVQ